GLFAMAHLAMQRLADRGVAPGRVLAALEIFDEACLDLTEGQYLDLSFEDRLNIDVEQYLKGCAPCPEDFEGHWNPTVMLGKLQKAIETRL
ncbi:MAG: hypothetical protein H8D43_02180, partial [Chloroflexi bacterium]|nr:hypothetical protein [Chloroflexota bacterium]